MKKDIHPKTKKMTVINTKGEKFELISCLGVKQETYHTEIDPESHPAWSKKNRFTGPSVGNMKKFEQKYPGLDDLEKE